MLSGYLRFFGSRGALPGDVEFIKPARLYSSILQSMLITQACRGCLPGVFLRMAPREWSAHMVVFFY